jgi:hypothetical protein
MKMKTERMIEVWGSKWSGRDSGYKAETEVGRRAIEAIEFGN